MLACFIVRTLGRSWPRTGFDAGYSLLPNPCLFSLPHVHPSTKETLCGLLDEMQRGQRHADQQDIADPWIETSQSQVIENVRIVNQVPHVEMQQVKAVACFADEHQRRDAQDLRKRIHSGESENDATEQWHKETVVQQRVGKPMCLRQNRERRRKPKDADPQAPLSQSRNNLVQFRQ